MHNIPQDRTVFKLKMAVASEDIDDQNHVNNLVYLRWVQDVSLAHWQSAASVKLRSECNWVVLRHEINYHAPALLNDEIELLTWVETPEGAKQRRMVCIQRTSDGKVLASTTTTWCLLDPATRKPKKISDEISGILGLKK